MVFSGIKDTQTKHAVKEALEVIVIKMLAEMCVCGYLIQFVLTA
jgi:hypothetical protein